MPLPRGYPTHLTYATPEESGRLEVENFHNEAISKTATYPERRADGSVWEVTYRPFDDSIVSERQVEGPPAPEYSQQETTPEPSYAEAIAREPYRPEPEPERRSPVVEALGNLGAGIEEFAGNIPLLGGIGQAIAEPIRQAAEPGPLGGILGPPKESYRPQVATGSPIEGLMGAPVLGTAPVVAAPLFAAAKSVIPDVAQTVRRGAGAAADLIPPRAPTFYHGTQPGRIAPGDVVRPQGGEPAFVTRSRQTAQAMGGPEIHEYNIAPEAKVLDLTKMPEGEVIAFLADLKGNRNLQDVLASLGYDVVHGTKGETMVVNPSVLRPRGAGRQGLGQLATAEGGFLRLDPGDIGGPTPPRDVPEQGVPPPNVVTKLVQTISKARKAQASAADIRSKELGARVDVAEDILGQSEGEEAFRASIGALRGKLPSAPDFEPLSKSFEPEEMLDLFEQIRVSELSYFDKLHVQEGLSKLMAGVVPQKAQLQALEDFFGPELGAAIRKKAGIPTPVARTAKRVLPEGGDEMTLSMQQAQQPGIAPGAEVAGRDFMSPEEAIRQLKLSELRTASANQPPTRIPTPTGGPELRMAPQPTQPGIRPQTAAETAAGKDFMPEEEALKQFKMAQLRSASKGQKPPKIPKGTEGPDLKLEVQDPRVKREWGEYIHAYTYNNMLSGPITQERNILGTLLGFGYETAGRAVTSPSEVVPLVKGFISGFPRGARRAAYLLKNGVDKEGMTDVVMQEMGGLGKPAEIGKGLNPFNAGSRFMRAADVMFKHMGFDAQLLAEATRQARREGLKGDVLISRIATLRASPSRDMVERAEKFARTITYTDEPDKVAQTIGALRDAINIGGFKPGRLFIPFLNTLYNISKRSVQMTPGGLAVGVAKGDKELIGRGALGTAGLIAALPMALSGNLTGAAPIDRADRDMWYNTGRRPYSIKVGDMWVPYLWAGPGAMPFILAASVGEGFNKTGKAPDSSTARNVIETLSGFVKDQSYISGMQAILEVASFEPDKVQRFMETALGQFGPLSGLQRQVESGLDRYVRDPEGWGEAAAALMPALSPYMPHRLTALGEDVIRPTAGTPIGFSPIAAAGRETKDPVIKELSRLGITPGFVQDKITFAGQSLGLTPSQYRDYQRNAGMLAKEMMGQIAEVEMPDEAKKALMEKFIDSARDQARKMALGELLASGAMP